MRRINDIGVLPFQFITAQESVLAERVSLRGLSRTINLLTAYYQKLMSIRSGSKISRIFRHIFEYKHTKRILGSNLALLVFASSFVPNAGNFYTNQIEQNVYTASSITLKTDTTIKYPLEEIRITQGYSFFHPAIDLDGTTGDSVNPIMKGEVIGVEHSYYNYGNSIVVDHQNGYFSRYAHLSETLVNRGDLVETTDTIGLVGSTGRSTGDHLHLEVLYGNNYVNPVTILPRE